MKLHLLNTVLKKVKMQYKNEDQWESESNEYSFQLKKIVFGCGSATLALLIFLFIIGFSK